MKCPKYGCSSKAPQIKSDRLNPMTRVVKKWSAKDATNCIITPSDLDHKYSRGVLGLITGSAQFPGAAVLTTAAASATGVGMVRFLS